MRSTLKAFWPTSPKETLFLGVLVVLIAGCFVWITRVYAHGVLPTILTALCISWLSMQVLAAVLEHRALWPPGSQFAGFYWGDSLGLPGIAAALCLMRRHNDGATLADNLGWRIGFMVLGIAAGIIFHLMEAGGTFYSTSQLHSPTKLWHNLFVFPVMIYFLASQAPLLFTSRWGLRSLAHVRPLGWLVVVLLLVSTMFWGYLSLVYDPQHMKRRAHIDYTW